MFSREFSSWIKFSIVDSLASASRFLCSIARKINTNSITNDCYLLLATCYLRFAICFYLEKFELSISTELCNHLDFTASTVSSNPIGSASGASSHVNLTRDQYMLSQMTDFIIFIVSRDTVLLLKPTAQSCEPRDNQVDYTNQP